MRWYQKKKTRIPNFVGKCRSCKYRNDMIESLKLKVILYDGFCCICKHNNLMVGDYYEYGEPEAKFKTLKEDKPKICDDCIMRPNCMDNIPCSEYEKYTGGLRLTDDQQRYVDELKEVKP